MAAWNFQSGRYGNTALCREVCKRSFQIKSWKDEDRVYPNSTLGGDRELLESCKDGDIPFVVQNTAPQVTFLPDTAVFDLAKCIYNDPTGTSSC